MNYHQYQRFAHRVLVDARKMQNIALVHVHRLGFREYAAFWDILELHYADRLRIPGTRKSWRDEALADLRARKRYALEAGRAVV